jgi:hypothetical protein
MSEKRAEMQQKKLRTAIRLTNRLYSVKLGSTKWVTKILELPDNWYQTSLRQSKDAQLAARQSQLKHQSQHKRLTPIAKMATFSILSSNTGIKTSRTYLWAQQGSWIQSRKFPHLKSRKIVNWSTQKWIQGFFLAFSCFNEQTLSYWWTDADTKQCKQIQQLSNVNV